MQHHRTTALVTGASRGIGAAIAVGLAADGIELVGIHYGSDARAAVATADRVRECGATPVLLPVDLAAGAEAAAELADRWRETTTDHGHDGTDVLVSNAGINGAQTVSDLDRRTYDRVVAVDLTAPVFLLHHLYDHLRPRGRVVVISTGFTRIAAPTHVAYSAAKSGLEGAVRAVAPDLAQREITVNAVAPGVIDTDINRDWIDKPGQRDAAAGLSAFGRLGTPDDVAEIVRHLASDAGRWTTAQTVDATGGTGI